MSSPVKKLNIAFTKDTKNEMYVYLGIQGFKEDPDEITRIIGVNPTSIDRKGDPIANTPLKCRRNYWRYRVTAKTNFDLEKMILRIFSKFKDKKKLKRGISRGRGQIVCVVRYADSMPTFELSPSTIIKISDLGCGFWLDYYFIMDPDQLRP